MAAVHEKKNTLRNIVVGTAGHVDHGKTALVKVLTAIDTDRLKEEKERGITIEAGFAYHTLPSGQMVSIVDVPGHEKFIKNMLRGVSGVDIALLVVAADDGVMPQTREHLDILKLLNVKEGVVVITKIDLVDEDIMKMATEEVLTLMSGSFLEGAPLIHFSARTGQGAKEVNLALEEMTHRIVEKDRNGIFRLPIDRVFRMTGYGTVVTGTLAAGRISKGDTVEIYPLNTKTTVRSIQIHNNWVEKASAGQRVGINLPNIKAEELERGMVLGEPDSLISTHLINVEFQYLESNRYPIKNKVKVRFHSGTSEAFARVTMMDRESLLPGETCFAQLRFVEKLVPFPYDRYIIRTLSPITTVGGGIILETNPRKYRSVDTELVNQLKVLAKRKNDEAVERLVRSAEYNPTKLTDVSKRFGLTGSELQAVCDNLAGRKRILVLENDSVIHKESYDNLRKEILDRLGNFHQQNPLRKDVSQEEIRSKISSVISPRIFETIMEELQKDGVITRQKGKIRLAGFHPTPNSKQRIIYDELDRICKAYRFRPLPTNELKGIKARYGEQDTDVVLGLMVGEGKLVRLRNHRLIHSESVEELKKIIKEHIEQRGQIALAESMKVLGIGRTQITLIYEYLDSIRFTMRVGDYRILRKSEQEENK